jgi:mitochondrial intermediate peptidase
MLAKTRYQHVSGTRCSTDFAEVPSQLMEFFCREPKILKLYAKHYLTGETLSDDMIYRLCESRKLFNSSDLQLQILHSILDQVFHGDYPLNKRPIDLVADYTRDYYNLPFVNDTYWHQRFSHFISYGAKYYSYLVSKAIATKIWSHCFAKDPLSSTAGENYRHKLLAYGGERKPQDLINSLIGFNVNNKSLVNSLVESL